MGKRSIENDLEELGRETLTDLSVRERVRHILKAEAAGKEERKENLVESVPLKQYRLTDPDYTDAMQSLFLVVSHIARDLSYQRERIFRVEAERDRAVALLMLDDSLGFDSHTEHDEVAKVYHALWEQGDDGLEESEVIEEGYAAHLAAQSGFAHPTPLDSFDDEFVEELPDTPPEPEFLDFRVVVAVAEFYRIFQSARILAEEYLDVTFDELMAPVEDLAMSEKTCENILETSEEYVEEADRFVEEETDYGGLEDQARRRAEGLAEEFEGPLFT